MAINQWYDTEETKPDFDKLVTVKRADGAEVNCKLSVAHYDNATMEYKYIWKYQKPLAILMGFTQINETAMDIDGTQWGIDDGTSIL